MSLNDSALPEFIRAQLTAHGIDGSNICFEVTETAAVANLSVAVERISSIKALGCRSALDDFGSGLSSFSYFQALPVDYIKIDGDIVKQVLEDPMSCAIVEAVQHVARAAGIETIAEHVENDALREKLRAIGIDYGQGYGIAWPQPLEVAPHTGSESMRKSV